MTRILAVSHTPIWPVRSGSANRRAMTLEALASYGTVDLLYAGEPGRWSTNPPAGVQLGEIWESPVRRVRPSRLMRARWLLSPRVPLQAIEWDRSRGPEIPGEPYDVIWYFRAIAYALASNLRGHSVVIDFDDLEDRKLRSAHGLATNRRRLRRRIAERRNTVAWERYQNELAAVADAVVVCSEPDRQLLATDNCFVVPNGFPSVGHAARVEPSPPTLLMVGLFEYEPNADGAEFFVRNVFPAIRLSIPNCQLRLVGRESPRVRKLAGEGVTVVGEVPDLTPEYQRASVAVVPVRFGSGTRVKILEAFARRVPVVSTTLGAAGLGVVHGQELLLADHADSFASACVSLIQRDELRRRCIENALSLYERCFSQSAVTGAIGVVLDAVDRIGSLPTPREVGPRVVG